MKTNRVLKLAVLALVMTLVTSSLVSGTYAKYATSVTGTGTAVVAKWVAKFGGETAASTENFSFNLTDTADTNVVNGRIAPGTEGSFKLSYDTSGSQVARKIKATMSPISITELPQLKFYSDSAKNAQITDGVLIEEDFGASEAGTGAATIYWEWAFDGDDAADTADGIAEATYNMTIDFSATQLD